MAINLTAIKAMIDEGLPSSPPAAPRSNTAESVRNFLKNFVDLLAAQEYSPDHDWTGTQLRFTRADGTPGNYVELQGIQGIPGPKGDPGTLTASAFPTRTTPINRIQDKVVVQRGDGVLEKVTLFQMAGGQPISTGNLINNGAGEFSDISNIIAGDISKLSFDATQSPLGAGKGSFKYGGPVGYIVTSGLIPINPLRRHRLSMVARHGDTSGANYNAVARTSFGLICLDADGLAILPVHYAKVSGSAQTTLAVQLKPGDTTMTLTSSAGWHNGATAGQRGFAWYPYSAGAQVYPDYGYTRNVSATYPALALAAGGAWVSGGILGNVVTLRSAWTGPTLAVGTKVANTMEGDEYMYIGALKNALVPNAWTSYEGFIQGINPGTTEDSFNLMFRPGTAYVRPLIQANHVSSLPTNSLYFTLDFREVGYDPATILAGNNSFTGDNSFAGDTTLKRIIASGNAPTIAVAAGAGGGATAAISAGSTDMAGTLTVTTGTGPNTNSILATITFATAFAAAPRAIMLTARNNQTGMAMNKFFVGTKAASSFTLNSTDVAPGASISYQFDYLIIA